MAILATKAKVGGHEAVGGFGVLMLRPALGQHELLVLGEHRKLADFRQVSRQPLFRRHHRERVVGSHVWSLRPIRRASSPSDPATLRAPSPHPSTDKIGVGCRTLSRDVTSHESVTVSKPWARLPSRSEPTWFKGQSFFKMHSCRTCRLSIRPVMTPVDKIDVRGGTHGEDDAQGAHDDGRSRSGRGVRR